MKNRKLWSWFMYDWANSGFALTVLSAFFPILFQSYWAVGYRSGKAMEYVGLVNGLTGFFVAVLTPFLAALAQTSNRPKGHLISWTIFGVGATVLLSTIDQGGWLLALFAFALSRVGFQFSNLFYDAMLPFASEGENIHEASAKGFAYGYLGGALLFAINIATVKTVSFLRELMIPLLPQISLPTIYMAGRYALLTAALWWLLFSLPLITTSYYPKAGKRESANRVWLSLMELKSGFKSVVKSKSVREFLLAYWLYIDGVHTLIIMSTTFGLSVGVSPLGMILSLFFVQIVAFPASLLTGWLALRFPVKRIIGAQLLLYTSVVLWGAFFIVDTKTFFITAIAVGMLQGGVQALSRSYFSEIIGNEKRSTLYFGIYNMVGRFSMILGPLIVAGVTAYLGRSGYEGESVRVAFALLSLLFIVGFIIFMRIDESEKLDKTDTSCLA